MNYRSPFPPAKQNTSPQKEGEKERGIWKMLQNSASYQLFCEDFKVNVHITILYKEKMR